MKKLLMFSLALFPLTTIGCATTSRAEIYLPPRPERKEIEAPKNLADCAAVIAYYERLVQEWEIWGEVACVLTGNEEKK